jgi:beta-galactosidase
MKRVGGLPSWLLSNPDVVLRSSEVNFLAAVEQFMTALLKKVHSYQYHLGGPIIIMQIENEYGSYGSDHEYLRRLRNMFLANDIKTILNTCNGYDINGSTWLNTLADVFCDRDWDQAMLSGNIPDLFSPTYLRTVNFGNDPQQGYKVLKRYQPTGPFFVTEYWPGSHGVVLFAWSFG